MIACTSKADKAADATAEDNNEVAAAAINEQLVWPDAVAIGVVSLDNDSILRPNVKTNHVIAIDFNATWCGPCRMFTPAFDAAAEKFAGEVEFIAVDVDNNPLTAQAFGVQSIPNVVIILPDGKTQNYVGTEDLLPEEKFFDIITKAMGK